MVTVRLTEPDRDPHETGQRDEHARAEAHPHSLAGGGAFRLYPRVGDRMRISIYRNVSAHQDSFTATNLRTGRSQTVRVTTSPAVEYHHAFVGSYLGSNADVMPLPATSKLLWKLRNSQVTTYGGIRGTLTGPWATVKEIDRTDGGVTVMYPGSLSASGADFSSYLAAAPAA